MWDAVASDQTVDGQSVDGRAVNGQAVDGQADDADGLVMMAELMALPMMTILFMDRDDGHVN